MSFKVVLISQITVRTYDTASMSTHISCGQSKTRRMKIRSQTTTVALKVTINVKNLKQQQNAVVNQQEQFGIEAHQSSSIEF